MSSAKVLVLYYSVYGHIKTLAEHVTTGVKASGAEATLMQVAETLPEEILKLMHAPPKAADVPVAKPEDLANYDGIIFGIPTRYGMAPQQVKALMDATGPLWSKGALLGKTAGTFFSTGSQGGGQETTALTFLTQLTHHGMIYVPMGFQNPAMFNNDEVRGGSAYGPGTIAGGDGSRLPTELELTLAKEYGEYFGKVTNKFVRGGKL